MSAIEIFKAPSEACGASGLSYRIVTRLVNEFKSGREAVKDHHCAGRIASVTTDFSIKLVKEPLKSDRRLSCKEMVQKSEISVGFVHTIICNRLGKRKCPPVG